MLNNMKKLLICEEKSCIFVVWFSRAAGMVANVKMYGVVAAINQSHIVSKLNNL